jgi:thiamine biosynthesis protein ThiS
MFIWVNGTRDEVSEGTTVGGVLDVRGLAREATVVLLNSSSIARDRLDSEYIREGDRIEVIPIFGGG